MLKQISHTTAAMLSVALLAAGTASLQAAPAETGTLPVPDGKPAEMSKPVQVFILLGQSNMFGFGKVNGGKGNLKVATRQKGLYPYLVDDNGNFLQRKDVRYAQAFPNGPKISKEPVSRWLGIPTSWAKWKRAKIGPELGIGNYLGEAIDAPVLVLKSCIGNRSLGWDLLPPSCGAYEYDGKLYPGHGEVSSTAGTATRPQEAGWFAGVQYVGDTTGAQQVLDNLGEHYPGATEYEVAGFFFWQGTKDLNPAHSTHYERHLAAYIKDLRKEFDAPDAKFVVATLGQAKADEDGNYVHDDFRSEKWKPSPNENSRRIFEAQMAVDGKTGKHPQFKGNVATVYTYPVSMGGSSGSHYDLNAETYMNVGELMGAAMVELLKPSE